jgi:hypothetical protein
VWDRDVVARNRVELFEHGGSGRSARFRNYRRLVSGATGRIGAALNRQEGMMNSAFGVIGLDQYEASGRQLPTIEQHRSSCVGLTAESPPSDGRLTLIYDRRL